MKTLDLAVLGVEEMDNLEMMEVDGGGIILGLAILGAFLLISQSLH